MKSQTTMTMRQTAIRSRRRPPNQKMLAFAADGDGCLPDDPSVTPTELRIEATDANGELSLWLTDDWWVEVLNRWASHGCTLVFQPTPGAIVHSAINHAAEMLLRVAPAWRLIGTVRATEITREMLKTLAMTHFHEVRVFDDLSAKESATGSRLGLGEMFGEIRRIQQQTGRSTPVLVRTAVESIPIAQPADKKMVPAG